MMWSFITHAWQMSDFTPKALFTRHESTASHEFIKVTQPASLTVTQQQGTVKVKGWDKESISIKIVQKGHPEALANTVVTVDKSKLPHELYCTVTKKDEEKNIANVTISAHVPFTCSVTVSSQKGLIKTKNLSRTQTLYADDGTIEIILDKFSVESSVFAHNKYGTILVEAPKKIQAQLSASTLRGSVTSELFITLQPHTTLLNRDFWAQIKKDVHGSLGEGGAPMTLEAENGDIKILAKR